MNIGGWIAIGLTATIVGLAVGWEIYCRLQQARRKRMQAAAQQRLLFTSRDWLEPYRRYLRERENP